MRMPGLAARRVPPRPAGGWLPMTDPKRLARRPKDLALALVSTAALGFALAGIPFGLAWPAFVALAVICLAAVIWS